MTPTQGPIRRVALDRVVRRDDARLPSAWIGGVNGPSDVTGLSWLSRGEGVGARSEPGEAALLMLGADGALGALAGPLAGRSRVYALVPRGWSRRDDLRQLPRVLIRRVPEVPASGVHASAAARVWVGGGWTLRLDAAQAEAFRQVFLRLFWHDATEEAWTGGPWRPAGERPFDVPELPQRSPVRLVSPETPPELDARGALVHVSNGAAPPSAPPRRLWFPAGADHHEQLMRLVRDGSEVVWQDRDLPDLVVNGTGGEVLLPGARARLRIALTAAQAADVTRVLEVTARWRFGVDLRLGELAGSGASFWLPGEAAPRAVEAEQAVDLPEVHAAAVRAVPETSPASVPEPQPLALSARYRWTVVPPRLPAGSGEDPLVGRWRAVDRDWDARLSRVREGLQGAGAERARIRGAFSRLVSAMLGFERTHSGLLAEVESMAGQRPSAAGPSGAPALLSRLGELEERARQLQGDLEEAERSARDDEAREEQQAAWRSRVEGAGRDLLARRAALAEASSRIDRVHVVPDRGSPEGGEGTGRVGVSRRRGPTLGEARPVVGSWRRCSPGGGSGRGSARGGRCGGVGGRAPADRRAGRGARLRRRVRVRLPVRLARAHLARRGQGHVRRRDRVRARVYPGALLPIRPDLRRSGPTPHAWLRESVSTTQPSIEAALLLVGIRLGCAVGCSEEEIAKQLASDRSMEVTELRSLLDAHESPLPEAVQERVRQRFDALSPMDPNVFDTLVLGLVGYTWLHTFESAEVYWWEAEHPVRKVLLALLLPEETVVGRAELDRRLEYISSKIDGTDMGMYLPIIRERGGFRSWLQRMATDRAATDNTSNSDVLCVLDPGEILYVWTRVLGPPSPEKSNLTWWLYQALEDSNETDPTTDALMRADGVFEDCDHAESILAIILGEGRDEEVWRWFLAHDDPANIALGYRALAERDDPPAAWVEDARRRLDRVLLTSPLDPALAQSLFAMVCHRPEPDDLDRALRAWVAIGDTTDDWIEASEPLLPSPLTEEVWRRLEALGPVPAAVCAFRDRPAEDPARFRRWLRGVTGAAEDVATAAVVRRHGWWIPRELSERIDPAHFDDLLRRVCTLNEPSQLAGEIASVLPELGSRIIVDEEWAPCDLSKVMPAVSDHILERLNRDLPHRPDCWRAWETAHERELYCLAVAN